MSDQRTQHPFHMVEAIRAQPEAFRQTARQNATALDRLAQKARDCRRIFLVGMGTSYHAARVGEHLLRTYAGELTAQAIHAFDFALYGPRLSPEDMVVVVSHRGTKRFTGESLARAAASGCPTALITGQRDGARPQSADWILETVGQEKSSAHTVSYTGSIAVLSALAQRLGVDQTGQAPLADGFLGNELPAALERALASEPQVAKLAQEHRHRRRIWITGGGPSAITAHEITLKIKETSYVQAEGLAIETLLHGPFQCVEAEDLFILIAPSGAAQSRVAELGPMIGDIGADYLVVSDGTAEGLTADAAASIVVPRVPEPFSALTCVVPLQLFAYYLALACGRDPDGFRKDDPRFAKANARVKL